MNQIFTPFSEEQLIPKEEMLEVVAKNKKFSIGIPKENFTEERRICLTPDAVQVLTECGHFVTVESGAGEGSFFTDLQFSEAGAQIVSSKQEVFLQDVILKIAPPTFEEINFLKSNTFLVSALQINLVNQQYFQKLAEKKINAVAFEFIEDQYGQRPLVRLIGEIAGISSILAASEFLSKTNGIMLGGITGVRPTEVVILGAGTVGEFAAKAATGLGASVRIFDPSLSKLRRLGIMLGRQIPTSVIDPKELAKCLRRADVLIGALTNISGKPVITEEMVKLMKNGSVIVDLSVDSGSNIETSEITTHKNPFVIKHGVLHCGLPNLTSRMPRSTSKAISNFFLNYLLNLDSEGGFENSLARKNELKQSLYMYRGRNTKKIICEKFALKFYDINLLIF